MRERREIVRLWREGNASVLVTLVHVEGSSYRRPGARLLVCEDGNSAGTISGGCLEGEILRKAKWMVRNGSVVQRYSTLYDDSADVPFGSGCGGIIDLLLEPVDSPECHALLTALESTLAGNERTVLSRLPNQTKALTRTIIDHTGKIIFSSEGLVESLRFRNTLRLFEEQLSAPQQLYVLGAGDDAKPLVTLAALLGWDVTVLDGRAYYTRPERFPTANRVSHLPSPLLSEIRRDSAVVLMTHSYEQDRELLSSILPRRPLYLGLLGARRRSALLISETSARLGCSIEDCCEQIFAPVGLDLGGDGPEEIALAVIAQIQTVRTGKSSGARRFSCQDVERYLEGNEVSQFLQTQCAMEAR